MYDPLNLRDLVTDELVARRESGHQVGDLEAEVAAAADRADDEQLVALLDRLEATDLRPDWGYQEPTDLEEIETLLPDSAPGAVPGDLDDRIRAAWLGRCAGCALGKPVEGYGWSRARIRAYLQSVDAFPLADYIPVSEAAAAATTFHPSWTESSLGRMNGMPRDDDIDYTVLALHILETYGDKFSSADVGREWLERMPIGCTYTAERAAYRNLINGRPGQATATWRNPYREWIGAQIRADMYGYVSPGDPRRAARLAWHDAALSHVANGVYGEMWAAALVACALTSGTAVQALRQARQVVPPRSRLAEALDRVMELHAAGRSWDDACDDVESRWPYAWVHTVNNASVVAAALLWGEGDFSRSIGLAVEAGLDTDCDGATVGSVFGALHGTSSIPPHWTAPLGDRVHSAIWGYDGVSLEMLIQRTIRLASSPNGPAPATSSR
jgi:ADP-ribosylglycohydrolase